MTAELPVPGAGAYVRAEVRDRKVVAPHSRWATRLDMEAFTNPVWIRVDQ